MKMKKYVVRLVTYKNAIVDGEVFEAVDEKEALELYINRCNRLGIQKGYYDKYTIENWIFD
ncbi:hypothetical protein DWZ70_03160 [Mediterraneibacter gnavus]|jgi:hypothetical protein|nr:hypothetical protein DWZ70_03160 [Mediterraneibacter gnavus]